MAIIGYNVKSKEKEEMKNVVINKNGPFCAGGAVSNELLGDADCNQPSVQNSRKDGFPFL